MPLKDFNEILANELQGPDAVAAYLEAALEDGGLDTLLVALRNVAKIKGEAVHSAQENPEFKTLQSILSAYGLRFSITRNDSQAAMQA